MKRRAAAKREAKDEKAPVKSEPEDDGFGSDDGDDGDEEGGAAAAAAAAVVGGDDQPFRPAANRRPGVVGRALSLRHTTVFPVEGGEGSLVKLHNVCAAVDLG